MSNKVWNVKYVLGNTGRVASDAGNPQTRRSALDGAAIIEKNGWHVWVEHCTTGKRIFEYEPNATASARTAGAQQC